MDDDLERGGGRDLDREGVPDLDGPLPRKAETGDPQEGGAPPADRPSSLGYGTTAAEERAGEPLDVSLRQEQREVTESDVDPDDAERDVAQDPIQLVRPEDEDVGLPDTEKDEFARAADPETAALSAEEAAMHIEPE
jgi:hypothetical protein